MKANFYVLFFALLFIFQTDEARGQFVYFDQCNDVDTIFKAKNADINCEVFSKVSITSTLLNATPDINLDNCRHDSLPTVWIKIEIDKNAKHLVTQVNPMGSWQPIWSIYSGDCENLNLLYSDDNPSVSCSNADSNPYIHAVPISNVGSIFYVAISGYGNLENPQFLFDFWTVADCSSCLGEVGCNSDAKWSIKSRSSGRDLTDPGFCEGEIVQVCFDYLYDASQTGVDWLQGLIPDFGAGWDYQFLLRNNAEINNGGMWMSEADGDCAAYTTEDLPFLCSYIDELTGRLTFCNQQCQSCPCEGKLLKGSSIPDGWFWKTVGGANCEATCSPSTNYGIGQVVVNIEFCLDMRVRSFANGEWDDINDSLGYRDLSINFQTLSDGVMGCWEDPILECTTDYAQIGPRWYIDCKSDTTKVLQVFAYNDENGDGIFNQFDRPLSNVGLSELGSNTVVYTKQNGNGFVVSNTDSVDYKAFIPFGNWIPTEVVRENKTTFDTIGFVSLDTIPQGVVTIHSSFLRCNSVVPITISTINTGAHVFSGNVSIHLDERTPIVSTIPSDGVIVNNIVDFEIVDLELVNAEKFIVYVSVPPQLEPFEELNYSAYLISSGGDTLSTYNLSDIIRCSFDPNDKLTFPNRVGDDNFTLKNEDIIYTIRYQNIGNDTAYKVQILDVLDKNIETKSFVLLESSHDVQVSLVGHIVNFVFENINLVDSSTNFEKSQGYLQFKVRAKDSSEHGTKIWNKAEIYFDSNNPEPTNPVLNTIVDELPCPSVNLIIIDSMIVANVTDSVIFKWFSCGTNELIFESLSPEFSPHINGSYYCIVESLFCENKTDCIDFLLSGVANYVDSQVSVFPNPASSYISIHSSVMIKDIQIWTSTGQFLEHKIEEKRDKFTSTIDITNLLDGLYLITIHTDLGIVNKKLSVYK